MNTLLVKMRRAGEIGVLELSGSLGLGPDLGRLTDYTRRVFARPSTRGLLLDFTQVGLVDSAGLGELVQVYTIAGERRARVGLVGASDRVKHLLEMARVDAMFPVYASEADALAAMTG